MKTKNVKYLKLSFVLREGYFYSICYDKKDASELFDMLVKLEHKKKEYEIKLCQALMKVSE